MNMKKYETPDVEIIKLELGDMIVTSGDTLTPEKTADFDGADWSEWK